MSRKQSAFETEPQAAPSLGGVTQVVGNLSANGLRFGIAVSRYNAAMTKQLVSSAIDALRERGATDASITVVWVPGAYEISSVIHKLAGRGGYDALLALGVVIQGETPHAGLINAQLSHSLAEIARTYGLPVLDGVVSAESAEQAAVRCSPDGAARGRYLGYAAIEMANVYRKLDAPDS